MLSFFAACRPSTENATRARHRKAKEESMVGTKLDDLRAAVELVRQLVTDWDGFVGAVEALTREHAELKDRYDRLLGHQQALQATLEGLRAAHEQKEQGLASLHAAHEALLREHEAQRGTLRLLQERCDAFQQDRLHATEELETLLRRLKP
jgi:chromosome segregation ATPase